MSLMEEDKSEKNLLNKNIFGAFVNRLIQTFENKRNSYVGRVYTVNDISAYNIY